MDNDDDDDDKNSCLNASVAVILSTGSKHMAFSNKSYTPLFCMIKSSSVSSFPPRTFATKSFNLTGVFMLGIFVIKLRSKFYMIIREKKKKNIKLMH